MAHGAALKQAWAAKSDQVKVGDKVEFFQMCLPCNGPVGPGPHRATVTAINADKSIHLNVRWPNKTKSTPERFVVHRGMADNGRFWDFKK